MVNKMVLTTAALALTVGTVAVAISSYEEATEVTGTKVVASTDYKEYEPTTRLTGEDVLDFIYEAPERKIAVLFKSADLGSKVINYGYRLGEGYDYEFDLTHIFAKESDEALPFEEYLDTSVGESWKNVNNLQRDKLVLKEEVDYPVINVANKEGDISLATGYLYTPQELSDVITQAEDLSNIESMGRYLATGIKNQDGYIVGIYIEEFAAPLSEAVLAHLLHSTHNLKDLTDYPAGDGNE